MMRTTKLNHWHFLPPLFLRLPGLLETTRTQPTAILWRPLPLFLPLSPRRLPRLKPRLPPSTCPCERLRPRDASSADHSHPSVSSVPSPGHFDALSASPSSLTVSLSSETAPLPSSASVSSPTLSSSGSSFDLDPSYLDDIHSSYSSDPNFTEIYDALTHGRTPPASGSLRIALPYYTLLNCSARTPAHQPPGSLPSRVYVPLRHH
jgi:hypothetical protein